ncbi:MAG: dephospho-CoA kinase, partial [Solirubrobacterales bacterium]
LDSEPLISSLRERWGEDIESGGVVDRAAVGRRVFTDPVELAWLEEQVHPLVQSEIASWFSTLPADCPVAVVEVPLLFEGEMADRFDVTVAVTADEPLRRERAESRGQVGLEGREGRQLSQAEKANRADRVIRNDGTTSDLEKSLREMLIELGAELPTDPPV